MKTFTLLFAALDTLMGALIGLASVVGAAAVAALLWQAKQEPSLIPDAAAYISLLLLALLFAWVAWPQREKKQ